MTELAKHSEKQSSNLKPGLLIPCWRENHLVCYVANGLVQQQEHVATESFQCSLNTYSMPTLPGGLLATCTASLGLVPLWEIPTPEPGRDSRFHLSCTQSRHVLVLKERAGAAGAEGRNQSFFGCWVCPHDCSFT